ncbi:hypothetical protein BGZ54_001963 [Gamsiella multidivaricata]|nr:hypothetical protein BGZ54_001963 [Gamsiella multidivaricata]
MDNTTCDPTNRTNSASNLLPKQDIEHPEQTFPPASLAAAQMEMSTDKVTDPDTVPIKKSAPRRVMVLIGMPAPVLPPRPVFPPELERYQIQDSGRDSCSQYSVQMQAYLTSLRQDYERQLKDYDLLKHFAQEDKSFANAVMDELDALDEDPFTLDSFENLMRMHASKGKDFILARVTTQDPNDDTKLYHSYYGAHQINKVLFRTQPDEGLLHRMKARNVVSFMDVN